MSRTSSATTPSYLRKSVSARSGSRSATESAGRIRTSSDFTTISIRLRKRLPEPMAPEPVLTAAPDRDEEFDRGLRPQRIKEMVGQRDVIERLNIVVDAARKRGEPLGPILFDCPPGVG